MELTISGKNKKYLEQVEKLATKLGLRVSKTIETKKNTEQTDLLQLMEEKAKSGGVKSFEDPDKALAALKKLVEIKAFKDIDDPVAWQKKVRKDRPIAGRND